MRGERERERKFAWVQPLCRHWHTSHYQEERAVKLPTPPIGYGDTTHLPHDNRISLSLVAYVLYPPAYFSYLFIPIVIFVFSLNSSRLTLILYLFIPIVIFDCFILIKLYLFYISKIIFNFVKSSRV